jgi:hypothetical protein
MQDHGFGQRQHHDQHADQDHPARHSENAGKKRCRHHGEADDGRQDQAHGVLRHLDDPVGALRQTELSCAEHQLS